MPDLNDTVADRVAKLPYPAQQYYSQLIEQAEGDVFGALNRLRASYTDGSLEPEMRPAVNMAMVTLTSQLATPEIQPKTESETLSDVRGLIEQARLNGDQVAYDGLRAGLEKTQAAAKAAEERQAKHTATLEASAEAYEAERKALFETTLAESKEMEMQNIRRMGHTGKEAEDYYSEWFENAAVTAAQRITGYTLPTEPIEETE